VVHGEVGQMCEPRGFCRVRGVLGEGCCIFVVREEGAQGRWEAGKNG
jgi:hypothetical protein